MPTVNSDQGTFGCPLVLSFRPLVDRTAGSSEQLCWWHLSNNDLSINFVVAIDLIVQTILDVVAHNEQSSLDFVKKTADDTVHELASSIQGLMYNSSGDGVTRRRVSKDAHDMRRANDRDADQRPRRTRYYSDSSSCRIVERQK